MRRQLIAFASGSPGATFDAGNTGKRYNCTLTGTAGPVAGDYSFTLGEGGVDSRVMEVVIDSNTAVASGDVALASVCLTGDTATNKRIQFRDKAGALVAPSGIVSVSFYRMPPLT